MKKLLKLLVLALAFWQALFNPVNISLLYAQEVTSTPAPTDSPSPTDSPADSATPTPTPVDSATPTPADTPSPTDSPTDLATPTPTPDPSLTTGDATSSSDAEAVSNVSQTPLQSDSGGCPTPTPISTPDESPFPSSDTATPTPTPTDTSCPTPTVGSDGSSDPTTTPTPSPSLNVDTTQTGTSEVQSSSSAITGSNLALTDDQLKLLTGVAWAIANSINIVNINLVGSNILSIIETILGNQTSSINLYDLFEQLINASPSTLPSDTTVTTNQTANAQTTTTASSDTGQNTATAGSAEITTGDATSLANSINLANLNFVGTNGVFAIFNILGSLTGDIIIPNGIQLSLPSSDLPANTTVSVDQQADVQSTTNSDANTGSNTMQGGSSSLTTGNATSVANTQIFANIVRVGDSWGLLFINDYGDWTGNLINWVTPGSSVSVGQGTSIFENDGSGSNGNNIGNGSGNLTVVANQNATVQSSTSATSNTGSNTLLGAGEMVTGNALSYANNFTLANFVGVGGGFFFGIVNVLGKWVGNLEVAYPDLTVSITDGLSQNTPGSPENYSIVVTNQGKAKVNNVDINFSANSEFTPPSDPEPTTWHLGSLDPGQSQNYNVTGDLSSAAPISSDLIATAAVSTSDTESNTQNNNATHSTLVVASDPGSPDTRLPDLQVDAWNNVNDFVYPGDTILAAITVTNQSPFVAHSVEVSGSLTNDHPMSGVPMDWQIGDLQPGQNAKITFSVDLKKDLPGGMYHISAEATGYSESGDASSSNSVVSDFLVKLKEVAGALAPEVAAAPEGQVLGASTENTNGFDIRRYLPYILAISGLALILIPALKRRLQGEPFLPVLLRRKKKHS